MGTWIERVSGSAVATPGWDASVSLAIRRLERRTRRAVKRIAPVGLRAARIAAVCVVVVGVLLVGLGPGWVTERRGEGFLVTYYRDVALSQRVCRKREATLFRDYGDARPAFRVPRDHFSSRWEGTLRIPGTATYAFYSQSKGRLRMGCERGSWEDESCAG